MKEQPLIKFNSKLPKLSVSEKAVLKLLVEAGTLIAPLYLEQEKQAAEISKTEIEQAGKKDQSLLSPYTVVEKINNKFIATPYHIKYRSYLNPIAEKLIEASRLTENKEFGRFLGIQAKALLDGFYEDGAIASLKMKPYILDISIGPLDHFDDKLFYAKASYYAWVGVLDIEGTNRLNNYKSITLSARRKALIPKERVDNLDNVKAKVLDVVLITGLMAMTKFVGINLPMDLKLIEKYGSELTLFNQLNDVRMEEQILPVFNKIFSQAFKQNFTKEDLTRGYLRIVALHELAHSFLYYKNSAENLKDLFVPIYELAATVLGLRMAGSLLLKDRITNKMLESMLVAFIARYYYLKEAIRTNKFMINYSLGGALFINFMLESGAIKQFKGFMVPNFTKVFLSIHELSLILENLLALGNRKDAETFIKKYQNQFA